MKAAVILKDKELEILLAAAGVRGFCGFRQEKEMGGTESEIPYLIHGMVRNKVIRQTDGELMAGEPYSDMINSLKNAGAVLSVETGKARKKVLYLYIGKAILLMEDSLNDKNAVKLQLLEREEVMDLLDSCFCPEDYQEYPGELITQERQENGVSCCAAVTLTAFERGQEGEEASVWFLYEGKYECFVKLVREDRIEYYDYGAWSSQRIMEAAEDVMRGGSHGDDTDGCICT